MDERVRALPEWIRAQIRWADENAALYERLPHAHATYQRGVLMGYLALQEAARLRDLQRMMGLYRLEQVPEEMQEVERRSAEMLQNLRRESTCF